MSNEPIPRRDPHGMNRRDALRTFALGGAGLMLPDLSWLPTPATANPEAAVAPLSAPLPKLLPAQAFTVLITYRDQGCLNLFRLIMEHNNFNVIPTPSAHKLLDIAHNRPVSLIISDLIRADINGYDLVKTIRADPSIARIPVMLWCTSLATVDTKVRALELDVDDAIALPVLPITELIASIARLLPVDPQSFHPRFRSMMNEV